MTDGLPQVNTVQELVELIDLRGLRTFEISGVRVDPRQEFPPDEVSTDIKASEARSDSKIETRFRATVEANEATFVVDVGLLFALDYPVVISDDAVREFLERVAVMSAYPFIREGIATTAARMELPVPVLGLLKQGSVSFAAAPAGQ